MTQEPAQARLARWRVTSPPPKLWDRISATRAAGSSITEMPALDVPRRSLTAWLTAATAIVAGMVLLLVFISRDHPLPEGPEMIPDEAPLSMLGSLLPGRAHAQGIQSELKPVISIDGHKVRAGHWVYEAWEEVDGQAQAPTRWDTLTVERGTLNRTDVWIMVRRHAEFTGYWNRSIDSIYVGYPDFRPLRRVSSWRADQAPMAIAVFEPGRMTFRHINARFDSTKTRTIPPARGALLPGIVEEVLPALPLSDGWNGVLASLELWERSDTVTVLELELLVKGRENVRVPAGRFETWRLEARLPDQWAASPQIATLWVDRSSGRVVRSSWPKTGSFQWFSHLVEARSRSP